MARFLGGSLTQVWRGKQTGINQICLLSIFVPTMFTSSGKASWSMRKKVLRNTTCDKPMKQCHSHHCHYLTVYTAVKTIHFCIFRRMISEGWPPTAPGTKWEIRKCSYHGDRGRGPDTARFLVCNVYSIVLSQPNAPGSFVSWSFYDKLSSPSWMKNGA